MRTLLSTFLLILCFMTSAYADGLTLEYVEDDGQNVAGKNCKAGGSCTMINFSFSGKNLGLAIDTTSKKIIVKNASELRNGKLYDANKKEIAISIENLLSGAEYKKLKAVPKKGSYKVMEGEKEVTKTGYFIEFEPVTSQDKEGENKFSSGAWQHSLHRREPDVLLNEISEIQFKSAPAVEESDATVIDAI